MQTLDGVHVLLVDDNADTLELFTKVMTYQGALVIPVTNAKAALNTLTALRADVLITDITMPEHDGFWLLREARNQGVLKGIPVLAVTALGPQHARRLDEAGFDAHLFKPVDPNELCTTVQALARGRKEVAERDDDQGNRRGAA